ncbi:CarD family transcriptional regulator [Variibacter gotjawalensis]|nr:CarD family transcriptional regulator [Variibacter gotjawalensis]NIK47950.1 CarD family transcriptional regulator [Variibacter gotjawalensis]
MIINKAAAPAAKTAAKTPVTKTPVTKTPAATKAAPTDRTSKKAAELARKPLQAAEPKKAEAAPAVAKQAPAAKTVAPAAKTVAPAAKTAAPAKVEAKKVEAKPAVDVPFKKSNARQGFKTNEFIVYPAHGVGQIVSIEEQEVAGYRLELFVISFAKDKMTLRVPTVKIASVGMRKLAEPAIVHRALETLKGRARIKRTMWSRRAQEYEAKINSGDIVAIAEVVRDLYRSDTQPEQSYSERQLYEAALDRLAREIAAVERLTDTEAVKQIEGALAKGPRRGPKADGEAAEGEEAEDDSEETVDEAA